MNRSERRAFERLPISPGAWELAWLPAEDPSNAAFDGLLVITEARTHALRGAGPVPRGGSLWHNLRLAFEAPPPPAVPSRPQRLACADPALADRLRRELKGLSVAVTVVAKVTGAEEALHDMLAALAGGGLAALAGGDLAQVLSAGEPPPVPGITVERDVWRERLTLLCELAPWRSLSDQVSVRFDCAIPELENATAMVIGLAGEQEGLVLFLDSREHEAFLTAASRGGAPDALSARTLTLLFLRPDDVEPRERASCARLGLLLPNGTVPWVFGTNNGYFSPTDRQQRVLLAAIEAVVGLCDRRLPDMSRGPAAQLVQTSLGRVMAGSTPTPKWTDGTNLLEGVDFACGVLDLPRYPSDPDGPVGDTLVFKLRKPDALQLAADLQGATAIQLFPRPDDHGVALFFRAGSQVLGYIHVQSGPRAEGIARLEGRVSLCVSAGGPSRRRYNADERVWSGSVTVERAGLTRAVTPTIDPIFFRPPEAWPKASARLIDFAAPLRDRETWEGIPQEQVRSIFDMAAMIWNLCVTVDYSDAPDRLPELIADFRKLDPVFALRMEHIAVRKRGIFAGDPRLFDVHSARFEGDELRVLVGTHLDPGVRAKLGLM